MTRAPKCFAQEANINPQVDLDSIYERVKIRNAIHEGKIQEAVEMINHLNPEVRANILFAFNHVTRSFAMIIPFYMHHSQTLRCR